MSQLPYPLDSAIPAGPSEEPNQAHQPKFVRDLNPESITEHQDPFAYLRYFETVFLIDDSASMEPYWDEVGTLLQGIAPICIKYDPSSINIYFVNHRPRGYHMSGGRKTGYTNIGLATGMLEMHDNVAGIFHNVKPHSKCKLDQNIASILDSYVYEYDLRLRWTSGEKCTRPLNLIVVTAGYVDGPLKALVRAAKRLDKLKAPAYQVGVQLFQVGDDPDIRMEMQEVADEPEEGVRDIGDATTWTGRPGELSSEAVLKVVLGAVKSSAGKQMV